MHMHSLLWRHAHEHAACTCTACFGIALPTVGILSLVVAMVVPDWLDQRLVGNGSFDKYNRATSQHILEVADVLCSAGPFEVTCKPYVTGEVKLSCDGQQHTL